MRRELGGGFELDDDPAPDRCGGGPRVHQRRVLLGPRPSAGARRARDRGSRRVVGLYRGAEQVGFARAVSDGATIAYLADVYVLRSCRGRGLGLALVREMVEDGPDAGAAHVRWMLHTADAQGLYARLGFTVGPPAYPLMERARGGATGSLRRP